MIHKLTCACVFVTCFLLTSILLGQQSSFSYDLISDKYKIGRLEYNGKYKSIADVDTAVVPPFSYTSVGKIENLVASSKGCVTVEIHYQDKQIIIFSGGLLSSDNESYIGNWTDSLALQVGCQPTVGISAKGKGRRSITFHSNNKLRIHLINIKEKHLDLFKFMLSTIEYGSSNGI